jgi:hypothetical protein
MDERQVPTWLDLAKILDAPTREDPVGGCRPTVEWLIRQSPRAIGLYEELHRDRDEGPSLMELAKLLLCLSPGPQPECRHTALWLVEQSGPVREALAELEKLSRDAGAIPFEGSVSLVDVLQRHLEVDHLVGARDWDDPMEVVDPMRERFSPFYGEWISIVHARLGRSQGEAANRLREVLGKLRRCAERDR